MIQYPSLKKAIPKESYKIELYYDNGEIRCYDFGLDLEHPFYQALRDEQLFQQVKVENGELVWESGQDFCPNTLYEKSVLL